MGKNYLNQAKHKHDRYESNKRKLDRIQHVEEFGRKAFLEGGRFYNIAGTKEADELITQAAISRLTGQSISERFGPIRGFQDKPWIMDEHGPWAMKNVDFDRDKLDETIKKMKLDVFMSDKYEDYKEAKENKPSLRERLFGKAVKTSDEVKDDKNVAKDGPEIK